jgi:hypothetical protein
MHEQANRVQKAVTSYSLATSSCIRETIVTFIEALGSPSGIQRHARVRHSAQLTVLRCSLFRTGQNRQLDQHRDELPKDLRALKQRQGILYLVLNLLELPYILGKSLKLDGAGYR